MGFSPSKDFLLLLSTKAVLKDESTNLSFRVLTLTCGRPGHWQSFENGGWYSTDFSCRVHGHKGCGAFYYKALTVLFSNGV